MWRLYDGLPEISQATIYTWLGGRACQPDDVPPAISHFTNTFDSYLDLVYNPTQAQIDQMVARQITSIDRRTPVIPIVYPARNHVGVVNGGKYTNQGGGYYRWEYLYFHNPDPAVGANDYYTASRWLREFCDFSYPYCGQVISARAIVNWQSNYVSYGGKVTIYGRDGRDGGSLPY